MRYATSGCARSITAKLSLTALILISTAGTAFPQNRTVSLTWTPSASSGVTLNAVLRAPSAGGPFAVIASTSANSYTDTVAPGQTVYYAVRALLNAIESPNSNVVAAVIPAAPAPPATSWVVDKPAMIWNVTLGGANTSQTITITNSGTTSITVSWSDALSWLCCSSGDTITIAAGKSGTITHQSRVGTLAAGTYSGQATITGAGIAKIISVTLVVVDPSAPPPPPPAPVVTCGTPSPVVNGAFTIPCAVK